TFTAKNMAFSQHINRPAVHAFVEALHDHRDSLGRLHVDGPVAALAIEYVQPEEIWSPGMTGIDALAFHVEWPDSTNVLNDLITNQLAVCTHALRTGLFLFTHGPLPREMFADLDVEVVPSTFATADFIRQHWTVIRVEDRGVAFHSNRIISGW